jgi:hypothetical protein
MIIGHSIVLIHKPQLQKIIEINLITEALTQIINLKQHLKKSIKKIAKIRAKNLNILQIMDRSTALLSPKMIGSNKAIHKLRKLKREYLMQMLQLEKKVNLSESR